MTSQNVLCLDCFPEWGGGSGVLLKQMRQLLAEGYRVTLVCPTQSPVVTVARSAGIATIPFDMGRGITDYSARSGGFASLFEYLRLTWKLDRVLALLKPDLVYGLGSRSAKSALLVAWMRRLPLCWSAHNLYRPGQMDDLLLRGSRAVICVSDAVRRQYASLPGAERKLYTLYNSIDVPSFVEATPAAFREELGLASGDVLAGSLGRISPAKGQREFVESMLTPMGRHANLHAAIVGAPAVQDATYLGDLRRLIAQTPACARFHLTGWRDDIPVILAGLDLVVVTSCSEAMPLVILEAMAAARPVVAFAVGGIPELIQDGVTGLLVRPGDRQGLQQAIEGLTQDPHARAALGRAARERALELFDDGQALPRFGQIIAGALHARD